MLHFQNEAIPPTAPSLPETTSSTQTSSKRLWSTIPCAPKSFRHQCKSPHPREKAISQSQGQTRFVGPQLQVKYADLLPNEFSGCRLLVAAPLFRGRWGHCCALWHCAVALPAGCQGASPATPALPAGSHQLRCQAVGKGKTSLRQGRKQIAFPTAPAAGCVMGNYLRKQWPLPPSCPARARPRSATLKPSL